MMHFTDKQGYNGIRSQVDWTFKASDPPAHQNPKGVYFTILEPDTPNFSVKTRIPKKKQEYVFKFQDQGDLKPYPGNKGRLRLVFYSESDYTVKKNRQKYKGATKKYLKNREDMKDE